MDIDLKDLQIDHPRERVTPARRFNLWCLLFFLLLIGGAIAFWLREEGRSAALPTAVTTATVRPAGAGGNRAGAAFSAAGWVKLPNYHPILVTPLTAGRLDRILVVEGDKVAAGQVVAHLHDRDFKARLAVAEAARGVAQADLARLTAGYRLQEVDQARAEVARLQAERDKAAQILARTRKLQPTGAVSLETLQVDQAASTAAAAALAQAQRRLALLQEGYRTEEIALAKATLAKREAEVELARAGLDYTRVQAPAAGVVLERLARVGRWVNPAGGSILSLYDPADLEAQIDVNQDDVAKVRLGQVVDLSTRAEKGRTFKGKVVLIEPKADQVKNIVRVKVKFRDPTGGVLFPDMVVTARFRSPEKKPAKGKPAPTRTPTLPVAAVVTRANKSYVYVIRDGRAHRRAVTLGPIAAGRYPVKDGVQIGERVAVTGVEFLSDGSQVRLAEGRGE